MSSQVRDSLVRHAQELLADLNSKHPSVYASVVWAYQDARVREAIAARLDKGETLTSTSPIMPDKALRRERVYFSFSPDRRLDAKSPGILVQVGDDNKVVEVVDPFRLEEWTDVTIARAADTLPLAAAVTNHSDFDERVQHDAKWLSFVQRSGLADFLRPGSFGGMFGINETICGGYPTSSDVISSRGRKEDPDPDTRGGRFDDCGIFE
jgi:hypothetical protein